MQHDDPDAAAGPLPAGPVLQFLEWIAACPRPYAEAMAAWRTTCPRLSAWEDATGDGLVRVEAANAAAYGQAAVLLTARGVAVLAAAQADCPPILAVPIRTH